MSQDHITILNEPPSLSEDQDSKTLSINDSESLRSVQDGASSNNREAWIQVILSHLINFNSFGYMLSFGIFQGYYKEVLGFAPSAVSWIGTTQLFLNFTVGVFSGRMMDASLYKYTLAIGLSLQLIGAFTTSICTKYYQLFLAQGICNGLGNGFLFCPAVALVSTYFPPGKRAIPLSIVACGGATGGSMNS